MTSFDVYFDRSMEYLTSQAWREADFEVHDLNLVELRFGLGREFEVSLTLVDPSGARWEIGFVAVESVKWDTDDASPDDRPPEAAGELVVGGWYPPNVFDIQTSDGQLLVAAAGAFTRAL